MAGRVGAAEAQRLPSPCPVHAPGQEGEEAWPRAGAGRWGPFPEALAQLYPQGLCLWDYREGGMGAWLPFSRRGALGSPGPEGHDPALPLCLRFLIPVEGLGCVI